MKPDLSRFPKKLRPYSRSDWPADMHDPKRIEVWASKTYLVQVFDEGSGVIRISVNRTAPDGGEQTAKRLRGVVMVRKFMGETSCG